MACNLKSFVLHRVYRGRHVVDALSGSTLDPSVDRSRPRDKQWARGEHRRGLSVRRENLNRGSQTVSSDNCGPIESKSYYRALISLEPDLVNTEVEADSATIRAAIFA